APRTALHAASTKLRVRRYTPLQTEVHGPIARRAPIVVAAVRPSATCLLPRAALSLAPAGDVRPYRERNFHVTHYTAELEVHPTRRTVGGSARLELVSAAPALLGVDLDAGPLQIREVR